MSEHLSSMSEDLGSNPHFPTPLEKGQKHHSGPNESRSIEEKAFPITGPCKDEDTSAQALPPHTHTHSKLTPEPTLSPPLE